MFRNDRLAACLLLVIFVIFPIQLPLLSCEVNENNYNVEKVLIFLHLQDSFAACSNYFAPTVKFDFGQQRVIPLHFMKLVNWSLSALNQEQVETQNRRAPIPLSSIPVYIIVRVLRN